MAMNKRTRAATESVVFLGVTAAIVVLLNVLGIFFFGRADVTQNRLFSLSEGSKRVVSGLDDTLEITAYFTKDLPPPFNATERYVRDILDEYQAASKGKVRVSYVNPDSDETRQQAESEGVQKVAHQKIENDAVQVVEGYRGLVFNYLGERKAIAAVGGTEGLEYDITKNIKLLSGEKSKVGVLTGHEGPTLAKGLATLKSLMVTYDLVEVDAKQPIDPKLRALLIIAPENAIGDDELRNIDAFVMKGGNLGIFGGSVKTKQDQQELSASPVNTGINRLLEKWGVKLNDRIVADSRCGQAPYQTPYGVQIPVPFPPMPIVDFDETQQASPVAYHLQQVFLPFSATLSETGALKDEKDVKITMLARSSKDSWLLEGGDKVDLKPRDPRSWKRGSERGPFGLVATVEGKLPSAFRAEAMTSSDGAAPQGPRGPERAEKPVHLAVFASSSFVRDEFLPPPEQAGEAEMNRTVALALNAVDWLAQEDELIAVRAKSVEEPLIEVPSTVKEAETEAITAQKSGDKAGTQEALDKRNDALKDWDAMKARTKMLNIGLVPLLFVAFGLVRWQVRKQKRRKISL